MKGTITRYQTPSSPLSEMSRLNFAARDGGFDAQTVGPDPSIYLKPNLSQQSTATTTTNSKPLSIPLLRKSSSPSSGRTKLIRVCLVIQISAQNLDALLSMATLCLDAITLSWNPLPRLNVVTREEEIRRSARRNTELGSGLCVPCWQWLAFLACFWGFLFSVSISNGRDQVLSSSRLDARAGCHPWHPLSVRCQFPRSDGQHR